MVQKVCIISVRIALEITEGVVGAYNVIPQDGPLNNWKDLVIHFLFNEKTMKVCENSLNTESESALKKFLPCCWP